MESCLVLIPARGGSKGIPKKNISLLGGKPLIEFTIKSAISAELSGRICLSTDDEEIRKVGLSFQIEAPFLRPKHLAEDKSPTIPVIFHALNWYRESENFEPDYVVLLQPTCPFRTTKNIKEAYDEVLKNKPDSLISINEVTTHPCEYIVKQKVGFEYVMPPPDNKGRQNFPDVFFINGAIYIVKVTYLRETGKLFDENAGLYPMKKFESIDIDEPEDLMFANWLYEKDTHFYK